MSFAKLKITTQIFIALAVLSFSLFGGLSYWMKLQLSADADVKAIQDIKSNLAIASQIMDLAHKTAFSKAEMAAEQFEKKVHLLGPLQLDEKTKIRVGNIDLPQLTVGPHTLSGQNGLIKEFKELTGFEAALLIILDRKVYRLSSLLVDKEGKTMMGSLISPEDPSSIAALSGEAKTNMVNRNGKYFAARVWPLKDESGKTIGAYSVRVDLSRDISNLASIVNGRKVGESGYLFATESLKTSSSVSTIALHPSLQGQPLSELKKTDPDLFQILQTSSQKGEVERYTSLGKERFIVTVEVPSWNWTLAGGAPVEEFHRDAQRFSTQFFIYSCACAFLMVLCALAILKNRLRLLNPIETKLAYQAQGDFTSTNLPENSSSHNELHRLASSINASSLMIKNLAQAASGMVDSMDAAIQGANSSSRDLVLQLVQQSSHLTSSATEMAVFIEKVQSAHATLAVSSSETSRQAQSTSATALSGQQSMERAQQAQLLILQGITSCSRQISELSSSGNEIRSMAKIITDIAAQTNLLALNAAIEAARAGESGRGFAVVADEVRKLAELSAQSASKIQRTIDKVAHDSTQAASEILGVENEVQKAAQSVTDASNVFSGLAHQSQSTSTLITSIDHSIQEQATAFIRLLSLSEQLGQGAKNLASTADSTTNNIHKLDDAVHFVQQALSQFKLPNNKQ